MSQQNFFGGNMSLNVVKSPKKKYDKTLVLLEEGKIKTQNILSDGDKLLFDALAKEKNFSGKKGEILEFASLDGKTLSQFIFLGLGKEKELTRESLKKNLFTAMKSLKGSILLESTNKNFIDYDLIGELVEHTNYFFDKYYTKDKKEEDTKSLELDIVAEKSIPKLIEGVELGKITNIVRNLVNEPSNVMTPQFLGENAKILGKEYGVTVKVYDEKEIEKLKMGAFLAVARASANRPKLIVMKYNGDPKSKKNIALVGKGLCYDSGGLSIKPTDGMLTMHSDMTGGATVIGAICALAKMKIKKNVTAIVAACENSISGDAYKPGDVITTMSGKTVEITNTDAEGRVTLADALTYAIKKEKADEIIDVATLTGAIIIALGENITGAFANNLDNYKKLEKAGVKWGEKYWHMPTDPEYRELINSHIADIKNSAGKNGSSITAAKFLEEFVENTPWIHLDIAGTSFSRGSGKYYKKGATGIALKTLYEYVKNN